MGTIFVKTIFPVSILSELMDVARCDESIVFLNLTLRTLT